MSPVKRIKVISKRDFPNELPEHDHYSYEFLGRHLRLLDDDHQSDISLTLTEINHSYLLAHPERTTPITSYVKYKSDFE